MMYHNLAILFLAIAVQAIFTKPKAFGAMEFSKNPTLGGQFLSILDILIPTIISVIWGKSRATCGQITLGAGKQVTMFCSSNRLVLGELADLPLFSIVVIDEKGAYPNTKD
ncbi:MAG: hypothetical protein IPN76_01560 [Saprospiraceae bacterium]|jgi:hypothetical protein|nr:hypothetical protein [Saprospiraceae bacterium]